MTRINKSRTSNLPRRKRAAKPTGRKPRKSSVPKGRNAEPGAGAKSLIDAVNARFTNDPDLIVDALVNNVVNGNLPSARLLVELANASAPPPDDKKKSPPERFSLAEYLTTHPDKPDRPCDSESAGSDPSVPEIVDPPAHSRWVHDHWENPDADPDHLARANAFEKYYQGVYPSSNPQPSLIDSIRRQLDRNCSDNEDGEDQDDDETVLDFSQCPSLRRDRYL